MSIIRDKKDKLALRPTEKKGELTQRRPAELWSDMDQLFDQFRSNFDHLFWDSPSSMIDPFLTTRTPTMDVVDLGNRYEMTLEMPGISKDNIEIQVMPNAVEISAKQENKEEEKKKNWLRRERSCTSFYRHLELPEEVKTDNVEAEMKDGVLTMSLPKVEPKPEYKATKVKIK
jgi:HSP20 family protein